jgi:Protein of unknown function (DUF3455)
MKLSLTRLLAAVVAALALVAPAHAEPASPQVPGTLVPAAGNKVFLVAHAVGVQIYRCDPASGGWVLVAPRANLYADSGKLIGTHSAGPTWQARDGSYVTARKVAEANLDPAAIDWLLLEVRTRSAGADGDRLAATTFIQRTATTGGRAPAASECDVSGEIAEIAYTADYYFWKAIEA